MNKGGFDIASLLMDSIRGQPKQVIYQDLSPLTEHTETVESHVLRVHLPDFGSENIRVHIDKNSMKLLVRCRKPLAQTTVARVELSLDVPKDADVGQIRGNFEQGWLSLSMPKKRITQDPDRKVEEEIPKEKAEIGERKKEEKAEDEERMKKEEPMPKEKAESGERKKEEKLIPKEKAESGERKKKEEPMPKEEQKKSKEEEEEEEEEEEDMHKETDSLKEKIEKNKTEDKPAEQERKKQLDKAESKKDTTEEAAASMYGEKPKACRKREGREGKWEGAYWKNKIEEIEEYWLDGELVDKLRKSFESKKMMIYAAAVGFTVGFLVAQRLRSRST